MITELPQTIYSIDDSELAYLYEHHDFSPAIRNHSDKVIVLMTQGWCPQWTDMQSYLPDFTSTASIFTLIYDKHPDFGRILQFKENIFGNMEVPYIRYYFKGELITTTNWLPKGTFAALLTREKPFNLK